MNNESVNFIVPEPIYISLLFVWAVALALAFVAGYFKGVADERKRKGL